MSEDGIKADPNATAGPVKPDSEAGSARQVRDAQPTPVQPGEMPAGEEELSIASPGDAPQHADELDSPPANWRELTRSAGPPAHWLALFEAETAPQAGEAASLESASGPEATLSGPPEPSPSSAQALESEPEDRAPTLGPVFEPPALTEALGEPTQPPKPEGRSDSASGAPPPQIPIVPPAPPSQSYGRSESPLGLRVAGKQPDNERETAAARKGNLQKTPPSAVGTAGSDKDSAAEWPRPESPQPGPAGQESGLLRLTLPTEWATEEGSSPVHLSPPAKPATQESGPVRLSLPVEPAPQENIQPPANPVTRLRLRPSPPARVPAETGPVSASERRSEKTPSHPAPRRAIPDLPVAADSQAVKTSAPVAPSEQPSKLLGSPRVSVAPGAFHEELEQRQDRQPGAQRTPQPPVQVPEPAPAQSVFDFTKRDDRVGPPTDIPPATSSLPKYPAPSFLLSKLTQPPAELQWSEPSDAHWPDLPEPLSPARPPERHGTQGRTLRPDHRLRLNQEQKGKSWNA